MGSSKGGGKSQGTPASQAPTVSQPPVAQTGVQNLSAIESQFVNAPWSEPGWQSNAPSQQSQYLDMSNMQGSQTPSDVQSGLAQWLFGE